MSPVDVTREAAAMVGQLARAGLALSPFLNEDMERAFLSDVGASKKRLNSAKVAASRWDAPFDFCYPSPFKDRLPFS